MPPLLHFVDRHPLATGTIGALSGACSALLSALHIAAGVAGDMAVIFGCLASLLTVCLLVRKWCRNDNQRHRHYRHDEPFDHGSDDLP